MKSEIKVEPGKLKQGMYVSRLDRPWIETSFLLEGLLITSADEIEVIKKHCNYVYVDTEKGKTFQSGFRISSLLGSTDEQTVNPASKKKLKQIKIWGKDPTDKNKNYKLSRFNGYLENISRRRKRTYKNKTTFSSELKTAVVVHEKLGNDYQRIFSGLRSGRNFDLDAVAEGITDLTNSIIRNPTAMTWVAHIKRVDEYTYSRALGTSVWCATFGRHLGLEKPAIETLSLGGLLLDIGKSKLPVEFLKLSRKLSSAEFRVMQKHVQFGEDILSEASWSSKEKNKLNDILKMVADHHERADASGYPDGLTNKQISFFGRMAGIVDSFDAMTCERLHTGENTKSANSAVNELYGLRNSKFQAELVEQFIQTVGVYPTGSLVELNTGEVGVVVAINSLRRLRPTLMMILDGNKESLDTLREIDLDKISREIAISHGLATGAFDIDISEFFL